MPDDKNQPEEENIETPAEEQDSSEDFEKKCDEYLAGWKRALADYDNLKKNLISEKGEIRRAVSEEFVLSLLPVIDNFDQALKFKPVCDEEHLESWLSGIMHVRTQLEDVIKQLGVEPFGRESDPFDPLIHESTGSSKDETKADDSILEVIQRGWKMGEKVIRAAKVIVNKLEN